MSDPIDEIFNGTPGGIDEDDLNEMEAANQQRAAELETTAAELEEKPQPDVAPEPKPDSQPDVKPDPKPETATAEQATSRCL